MSTTTIAFFNNKGGVGKTSLVYHVAWMMADVGSRVVAADLDPQGNLSAAFLDEDGLEALWPEDKHPATIYGAVRPLKRGVGDIQDPLIESIHEALGLIPGDMALSEFEDDLSQVWPKCLDGDERAFRVISAFWRVLQRGADAHRADVGLIDLFSLQGLRNLGPTLREWRRGWAERRPKNPAPSLCLPNGKMQPIGYIVMQHSVRRDRPVKSYDKWIARIPSTYRQYVLNQDTADVPPVSEDPCCFATLKHYRGLMPMAQEARKPIFHLKPADGALGAHMYAVQDAHQDFENLTRAIAKRAGLSQS
jgi:chromosome partitioning protein